jgi:hypothetical protein
MPKKGGTHRKIFESQLGKPIKATRWEAIKAQMIEADMPLSADNLRFVAKCKRISRHPIKGESLNKVIKAAASLGDKAYGFQIMRCAFSLNPQLTKDKFYRAFRTTGFKFQQQLEFQVPDLGEVLYKIFVES